MNSQLHKLSFDDTDDPPVYRSAHDALFNCEPMTREDVEVCAVCGEPADGRRTLATFAVGNRIEALPVHNSCLQAITNTTQEIRHAA